MKWLMQMVARLTRLIGGARRCVKEGETALVLKGEEAMPVLCPPKPEPEENGREEVPVCDVEKPMSPVSDEPHAEGDPAVPSDFVAPRPVGSTPDLSSLVEAAGGDRQLAALARCAGYLFRGTRLDGAPAGRRPWRRPFEDPVLPMETETEEEMAEMIRRNFGLALPLGAVIDRRLRQMLVSIFTSLGATAQVAQQAEGLVFSAATGAWSGPDDEVTLRLERTMRALSHDPLFTLHRCVEWVCGEFKIPYHPSDAAKAGWLRLGSGERVVNRHRSQLGGDGVERWLHQALSQVQAGGRRFIEEEINLHSVAGRTICVQTCEPDKIVWAKRPGKDGYTRFAFNRQAEPTSWVTIVLKKAVEEDMYVLVTAFFGRKPEPEPWDERADQASYDFWNGHAMCWGAMPVDERTLTTQCPWPKMWKPDTTPTYGL